MPNILMVNGGLVVVVETDGRCEAVIGGPYAEVEAYLAGELDRVLQPVRRKGNVVDEASAILLARSYAIRKGLLATDMVVEERQLVNGEWLVSIVPGPYLPKVAGAPPCPTPEPSVVLVDREGKCGFFFERDERPEDVRTAPPGAD